mmetsp:Transcript_121321/g.354631  ORF Transcript_121321/g.354631 Transcript_121321/m.354631 type:complete len:245 (-) Transcript_121321:934-1668(-)
MRSSSARACASMSGSGSMGSSAMERELSEAGPLGVSQSPSRTNTANNLPDPWVVASCEGVIPSMSATAIVSRPPGARRMAWRSSAFSYEPYANGCMQWCAALRPCLSCALGSANASRRDMDTAPKLERTAMLKGARPASSFPALLASARAVSRALTTDSLPHSTAIKSGNLPPASLPTCASAFAARSAETMLGCLLAIAADRADRPEASVHVGAARAASSISNTSMRSVSTATRIGGHPCTSTP